MPTVREFLFGGDRRVPKGPLPSVDPLVGWKKKPRTGLRATWLGHSTVLIEIDGLRVLTDPVWGLRASPSQWAGPKRFQPVPVAIRSLPPLDAVVISHDHYDHLDYTIDPRVGAARRAVRDLARRRRAPRGLGRAGPAHRRARLVGVVPAAEGRPDGDRRALAAFLRSGPAQPELDAVVVDGHPVAAACGVLQRRHGTHDRIRRDPQAARPVRPGDARGRRVPSGLGSHPPRPGECARSLGPARQERVPAGALGHVQSRDARVGRTGRDPAGAGRRNAARSSSCHGSANRSSRLTSSACHPGGVRSNGNRDARSPSRRRQATIPKNLPWPVD